MRTIAIILFISFIFHCCHSNSDSSPFKVIRIECFKDSCYILADSINRQFDIIENTIKDTVILGVSIVPPQYTGRFNYLMLDKRIDASMDPQSPKTSWSKTKMICLNLYKGRATSGYLLIRYKT